MDANAVLEISTLGGLSIRLAGEPVTALKTRKVEALLVYLASPGGRTRVRRWRSCSGRSAPRPRP